jgi:protein O-mannosyl-transferase
VHPATAPIGRSDRPAIILIAALSIIAFAPALTADFVTWDDDKNFTNNPYYRGLGWDQLTWMWSTTVMGHYIPLSWMTLGLDYEMWGMEPRGYHLTNVILHAAAAVALYFVTRRLLRIARPDAPEGRVQLVAVASALLFSVHPLRTESVAWVTERRDMLSLLLMLGSVMAYLRFSTQQSRRAWAASIALFAAALLSKATVVTLPLVLLILEWYPLGRLSRQSLREPRGKKVIIDLAPFFALSVAAGVLSIVVLNPPPQFDLAGKVAVSAYAVRFYLTKWLWPSGLSPLHELPQNLDPLAPAFLISYVFTVAIVIFALVVARRNRAIAAILGATAVMILPLIGVVQNGPQIVAGRYTYHAAAALSLLPALLLFRWHSRVMLVAASSCVIGLGAMAWRQSGFWRNSEALWTRVLAVENSSRLGLIGLGNVRITQARYEEALDYYQRGVALNPDYAEGQNNLGSLLARKGRFAEAIPHFERTTQLEPGNSEAWLNWGLALAVTGRYAEAIPRFDEALRLDPRLDDARAYRERALERLKR